MDKLADQVAVLDDARYRSGFLDNACVDDIYLGEEQGMGLKPKGQ